MSIELVERQAKYLADENRKAEPDIETVYWFPDEEEVRLIELTPIIPISGDGWVHPFYFQPSPPDDLPAPSGIAMIRPEEFGRLKLPEDWGGWERAILLENGK
jgi:hypothetical protein